MTPEREAEIRTRNEREIRLWEENRCIDYFHNPADIRDLLAALDEARKERDQIKIRWQTESGVARAIIAEKEADRLLARLARLEAAAGDFISKSERYHLEGASLGSDGLRREVAAAYEKLVKVLRPDISEEVTDANK